MAMSLWPSFLAHPVYMYVCVFVYMCIGRLATNRTASFPAVRRVEIAEWTRVRTVTTCHVYDHLHRELAHKIQDGGGRHIGKSKNCHISATALLIFMKFGTVIQNGSLNRLGRWKI